MKTVFALAILSFAFPVPPARAHEGPYGGAQRDEFTVAPHDEVERCIRMAKDFSFNYAFSSSAPTDFNIHYHDEKTGGLTVPVEEKNTVGRTGSFTAWRDGMFCLLWENRGDAPAGTSLDIMPTGKKPPLTQ